MKRSGEAGKTWDRPNFLLLQFSIGPCACGQRFIAHSDGLMEAVCELAKLVGCDLGDI